MRQAYRADTDNFIANGHTSGLVHHLLLLGALTQAETVSVRLADVVPRAAALRLLAVAATTLLTRMTGVTMTVVGIDPAALMIGSYS